MPRQQSVQLAVQEHFFCTRIDQADYLVIFICFESMFYGFGDRAICFKPLAGTQVEFFNFFERCRFGQALAQHIGEQMMVAIPLPAVIQRDNENVLLL